MRATTTLRSNRLRVLRPLLISILFVLLGLWNLSVFGSRPEPTTGATILSLLTIALGGLCGSLFLYKLLANKPEVIFTPEGFTVPQLLFAEDYVGWKDVRNIRRDRMLGQDVLVVERTDPQAYGQRSKGLKRLLRQSNLKHYGSPLLLHSKLVEVDMQDLEAAFQDAWNQYKSH